MHSMQVVWRRLQQLMPRESRRFLAVHQRGSQDRQRGLAPPFFVALLALDGDAADFVEVRPRAGTVAQVEAVDVAVRHVQGALALRWGHLALLVSSGRLQVRLAFVPLDAVAVEHPEGGPGIQPAQQHHVALDRFQEQPAGVIGAQIVQMPNDRDLQARLHEQGRQQSLLQPTPRRMLPLGLRQHDGQTMTTHDAPKKG